MTDTLGLADCTLAAGPFDPTDRRCDWCGGPLEGRRKRWCQDDCSLAYGRNHIWSIAKGEARKRDGHRCQRCGQTDGNPEAELFAQLLSWWCPPRPFPRFPDFRAAHPDIDQAELELLWRTAVWANGEQWRDAHRMLEKVRRAARLEVHHLVPVLGRHADTGCHHHLDGLVSLCHRCHLVVTAEQRTAGMLDGTVNQGVR